MRNSLDNPLNKEDVYGIIKMNVIVDDMIFIVLDSNRWPKYSGIVLEPKC